MAGQFHEVASRWRYLSSDVHASVFKTAAYYTFFTPSIMAEVPISPFGNIAVASPEEYRKRKVALISGMLRTSLVSRALL